MRRLRRVYPHSRLRRIRHQPPVHELVGRRAVRVRFQSRFELPRVVLVAQLVPQRSGGRHRRAVAVHRVEARERERRLVPQEYQVGLDCLHHPLNVVDDAVEGAVCQRHHLDAVELSGPLQF